MSTIAEDIQASIKSLETGGTAAAPAPAPAQAPANDFAPVIPEKTDGTQPPAAAPTPPRADNGQFKPADKTAEGSSDTSAAAQPPVPTAKEADQNYKGPIADGVKLDPAKPPSSWTPQMREKWSTIPEDIRGEIIRREESMAQGIQKLKAQYEPADNFYKQVMEHNQYFQHIQTTPSEYFSAMLQAEQTLSLGNPAQKMEMILKLADDYGIPFRQALDEAMGGGLATMIQQSHQHFKTPAALPPEIMRELSELRAGQQKLVSDAAQREYDEFMSTEPAFFEDVKEQMAKLIESGAATGYKDAYETAVWSNPELRQKMIAQGNGQAQLTGVAARQAAAAAVATPPAASIAAPPTSENNDDIFDAVRNAWKKNEQGPRV